MIFIEDNRFGVDCIAFLAIVNKIYRKLDCSWQIFKENLKLVISKNRFKETCLQIFPVRYFNISYKFSKLF